MLVTCVVEHGREGVTNVFGHAILVTRAQKRVGLIDEEQDTLTRAVDPLEELVELGYGLLFEGCHITTGHDCILQTCCFESFEI